MRTKLLPIFIPASMLHSHATSFGFKEVREEEKSQMVGNVFSSVASNYDLMNDVMSGGLHRLWKERILESINSVSYRARKDMLDNTLQEETQIYVCDINPNMLNVGKKRAQERGLGEDGSLVWVQGDAEALTFEDDSVDGYTIAFGIRNVTHIEKVLAEAYRYDYYSFSVIPAVGELVAGDRESYQYLVESIRRFPSQEMFASMIADAGFQKVEYENLVGGVVAIHSGLKISRLF
ncbi:hypothetical protein RJ639_034170 [Escallonia herrerae]|uniref:2-methoxy-6-polyprenyl-1,4-benzoquinol methylase, mitochondrial n=1 Tax=Escallonia herrerae TaxID=1293975 RepID=A0AA88WY41_9ASTE|nr:hypothetical protein RJ639_034170 [Escallonia herrerae]